MIRFVQLRRYTIALMLMLLATLSSCEKLTDINKNPNNAENAHPQALLTKIQWDAFSSWHGTAPLYALKMLVQTDGENTNQLYTWQRSSFAPFLLLRNVNKMEQEAQAVGANGSSSYIALAKFFRAYYFYNMTLIFGDIPYSEAAQAESASIFTPRYDLQKDVFVGILDELKAAAELLQDQHATFDGDIIYQGDPQQWVKLINSFRLKVLMTLSNKEGDFPRSIAAEFADIYASKPLIDDPQGAADAQLVFLNQEGNRYPEFNASSYGSGMYMDSTFIQRMQERQDPRLFVVATQTRLAKEQGLAEDDFKAYEGGDPIVPYAQVNSKAVAGRLSKVHDRYHKDPTAEPFVLLGYAELQFIVAEAMLRGWIQGEAKQPYNKGVMASFAFYERYAKGLSAMVSTQQAAFYLENHLVDLDQEDTVDQKIARVLMQKYLRAFHQGGYTAYFDHLRTGYPSFRKGAGVRTAYRWMYPQSEYNTNTEQVSEALQRQFAGDDNINLQPWWIK